MIPYKIIWEEEISSDSLEIQDSPRTNLVDRPLTETRQMPSTSPVEEVCAETSESLPTNKEECRKCKRRGESSNGVHPKKIKKVHSTKKKKYNVSSTDTDASDSMDHLDTPPCTTKEQEYSVSPNYTDLSDCENSNGFHPKKIKNVDLNKKKKYNVSSTDTDASDSIDHLDTPPCTTKEQKYSVSPNYTDSSDCENSNGVYPKKTKNVDVTKKKNYSDSSNDTDASDSMEYLDTPPF